jgi:phthiocerol/phenolphthiocerol synthesis type-I polyketide synthase B
MLKADSVRAWITDFLASLLSLDAADIRGDSRFSNLGLDSVDAVVAAGAMEEHFDTEIDPTLILRNSTIDELLADLRASGIVE